MSNGKLTNTLLECYWSNSLVFGRNIYVCSEYYLLYINQCKGLKVIVNISYLILILAVFKTLKKTYHIGYIIGDFLITRSLLFQNHTHY